MIQFFNTLSGKTEEFKPLRGREVGLYTCGPTVYDYAHIGNFRAFVFEDLLRRFLEFKGYKVKHVMNITDVDDKTIAGALREGKSLEDYTAVYIQAFKDDIKALNCLAPTIQPRATYELVGPEGMLELIGRLIQKGVAYERDGSIYFSVSKFPGYGKLSKKKLEMNIAGASERMDADEYDKDQASDFVLWKKAKEGEPAWESNWGKGRPGWHIECSAMSMKYLAEQFDIHAGGEDLIFPHHENEIAQSEAASGKDPFVKYWLHCKFLLVDGEKMSKSKGNFYTLRDLLAKGYDPMAVRYELLATHYRSPLNFTLEGLKDAGEMIKRLDDCYWQCKTGTGHREDKNPELKFLDKIQEDMLPWLEDDLNISGAFAKLGEAVTEINKHFAHMNEEALKTCVQFFEKMDRLFGFDITKEKTVPEDILNLMSERLGVRRKITEQNDKSLWGKSDELRNQIQSQGWIVKDGKPGELSTLKKKRRVWDK